MTNREQDSGRIGEFLKENDDFLITSHYAPDGDNIGSCAGMYHALRALGKKAVIINEDGFVERFGYLFPDGEIPFVKYSGDIQQRFSNVIILDTATFERIGKVSSLILPGADMINIDHHPANTGFGTVNYVDTKAASASQIVLELLKDNGMEINRLVSDSLLSGLLSDTGGLRFANTDRRAVTDVLDLMGRGSDLADITDKIFLRLKFQQTVRAAGIVSNAELFAAEKLIVAYNDQENNPLTENEPVLMELSSVEEAEICVFIRRIGENKFKLSLRSKGGFDVNSFSAGWGGGGHKNAAGIKFSGTYEELLRGLVSDLKKKAREFYAGT